MSSFFVGQAEKKLEVSLGRCHKKLRVVVNSEKRLILPLRRANSAISFTSSLRRLALGAVKKSICFGYCKNLLVMQSLP